MKLEIDTSKPDDLRAKLRECEALLAILKQALALVEPPHESRQTTIREAEVHRSANGNDCLPLPSWFASLSDQFTAKDAFEAGGGESGVGNQTIRKQLSVLVASNKIAIDTPGKGRRPTLYRKQ